jgi:hypothetical protein
VYGSVTREPMGQGLGLKARPKPLCIGCGREFSPSRRHKRQCQRCARRAKGNAFATQMLLRLPDLAFSGRTEAARVNARSLAHAVLEHLATTGLMAVGLAELPDITGRQMVQVQRALPRCYEAGVLSPVVVNGKTVAVKAGKVKVTRFTSVEAVKQAQAERPLGERAERW